MTEHTNHHDRYHQDEFDALLNTPVSEVDKLQDMKRFAIDYVKTVNGLHATPSAQNYLVLIENVLLRGADKSVLHSLPAYDSGLDDEPTNPVDCAVLALSNIPFCANFTEVIECIRDMFDWVFIADTDRN